MRSAVPLPFPGTSFGRSRVRPLRRLFAAVGWGIVLLVSQMPGSAEAQSATGLLALERDFEAAFREYQAAEAAFSAARIRSDSALVAVNVTSGDARRRALARAHDLSLELQRLDRRVRETGDSLNVANRRYVSALDLRIDELTRELSRPGIGETQRQEVLALVEDLTHRLHGIDQSPPVDDERIQRLVIQVFPDMRDTPRDMEDKAHRLEVHAMTLDSIIAVIDERVEELEGRRNRNNTLRDFGANLDRFGGARLPVGAPQPRSAGPRGSDGSGTAGESTVSPLTPEEEIANLRRLQGEIVLYRDQNLAHAAEFRRRAIERRGG